jgi:Transglutaminase-like superfamily
VIPVLFLRALLLLFSFDLLKLTCRFQTIHRVVKQWPVAEEVRRQCSIKDICSEVDRACVWYPKHAMCLQRSFVTTYLLRRNGHAAQLVLGAQKLPFKAHAWVEIAGRAINERTNVKEHYAVWERC